MTSKNNKSLNKTKLIFLIGIPLLLVLSLALIFTKAQRREKEQYLPEEEIEQEETVEQYPQEPIGSTSVDCEVRFDTPTRNLCQNDAGPLVIKGTVVTAPPSSKLQTSWFQVEPVRTTPRTSSFRITSLPYSFSTTVQWPGIRGNKSVQIRALADLYDADGRRLPHCSVGNTTYWYPYLKCGAILESR